MLPPVYEGVWDMNFDIKLVSGHEIKFVELLATKKIGKNFESLVDYADRYLTESQVYLSYVITEEEINNE